MNTPINTPDELQKAIGEIEMAMRVQLACGAIAGDSLREAVDSGLSLEALATHLGDYPAALQVKIDLANRLNALMKSPGSGLVQALDALRAEGWLDRIENPDDAWEAV